MTKRQINLPFTLTIRKCTNGFAIKHYDEGGDDSITCIVDVVEEPEDYMNDAEATAMLRMLYMVMDYFDPNMYKRIAITKKDPHD